MCERCEQTVHEFKEDHGKTWPDVKEVTCRQCGKKLEKTFEYCPYCGTHTT